MITLKLLDILKSLPIKSTNQGNLILNSDIINACKLYGQDNHQYIEVLLKDLENQNLLTIVYMDAEVFEDSIVGIKLYK